MSDQQKPLSADDEPFVPSGEPKPFPAGKIFKAEADTWYNLMAHYKDWDSGNPISGLMYPVSTNAATTYWDYQCLGYSPMGAPPTKIKMWGASAPYQWVLDDGNFLSMKRSGWVYRSSAYPLLWQIVDGYLHNNYWDGQVGYAFRSGLEPNAYYMGMGQTPFTCELVPAQ
jgi:hypothetical protein